MVVTDIKRAEEKRRALPASVCLKMQISNANNSELQVHKDSPIKGVPVMGQLLSKPPHSAVMQNQNTEETVWQMLK